MINIILILDTLASIGRLMAEITADTIDLNQGLESAEENEAQEPRNDILPQTPQ